MTGKGYAWGKNLGGGATTKGVLGVGDVADHPTPTIIVFPGGTLLQKVVSATALGGATDTLTALYLISDGTVYVSGSNISGRHGNGSTDTSDHSTPILISGLSGIVDIAIGQAAFALDGSGNLYGWGGNLDGTLGNGTTTAVLTPTIVKTGVQSMAGGSRQSALRLTGGQVQTCGINLHGALGQGVAIGSTTISTWTNISGSDVISSVSCGRDQIMYVLSNGTVKASGDGGIGALGPTIAGLSGSHVNVPTIVDNLSNIVEAFVWDETSAFRDSSGNVYMYGSMQPGGGDGSAGTYYGATPDVISLPSGATYTALAYSSSAGTSGTANVAYGAIASDGKLYTWGAGFHGQMGSGADPSSNASPVSLNGLTNLVYACRTHLNMFAIGALTPAVTARNFVAIVG